MRLNLFGADERSIIASLLFNGHVTIPPRSMSKSRRDTYDPEQSPGTFDGLTREGEMGDWGRKRKEKKKEKKRRKALVWDCNDIETAVNK